MALRPDTLSKLIAAEKIKKQQGAIMSYTPNYKEFLCSGKAWDSLPVWMKTNSPFVIKEDVKLDFNDMLSADEVNAVSDPNYMAIQFGRAYGKAATMEAINNHAIKIADDLTFDGFWKQVEQNATQDTFSAKTDYCTHIIGSNKIMTPDHRLKKLFAEEKISADKYSELFGQCTHRDVDDLVSRNPLPIGVVESKPFNIIEAIESKIYALALDPSSYYLMMGARNIHELHQVMIGHMQPIIDKTGGMISYKGWEIKPAPHGYSNRHLEIVGKEEYRYLVDVNGGNSAYNIMKKAILRQHH